MGCNSCSLHYENQTNSLCLGENLDGYHLKNETFLFPIGLLRFLLLLFGRSLILWSRLDCTRIHYIAQTGLKLTATPLPLSLEFRDCKHDPPWLPTDVLRLTDFELCHSKCGNLHVTFGGLASKCTTAFTAQRKRFWKAV